MRMGTTAPFFNTMLTPTEGVLAVKETAGGVRPHSHGFSQGLFGTSTQTL
jgi:hypothetical protein